MEVVVVMSVVGLRGEDRWGFMLPFTVLLLPPFDVPMRVNMGILTLE